MSTGNMSLFHFRRIEAQIKTDLLSLRDHFSAIVEGGCSVEVSGMLCAYVSDIDKQTYPMLFEAVHHWAMVANDVYKRVKADGMKEACALLAPTCSSLLQCREHQFRHFQGKREIIHDCRVAMDRCLKQAKEHPDENIFAMSNARFWKFLGEAESSSRSITLSGLDFDRLEVGRLEVPLPESEYDCFIPISLDLCGFSVPPSAAFFT